MRFRQGVLTYTPPPQPSSVHIADDCQYIGYKTQIRKQDEYKMVSRYKS